MGRRIRQAVQQAAAVFDQGKDGWFWWNGDVWNQVHDRDGAPVIKHPHFTGTGTRTLEANGKRAIADLFARSFR